MMSCFRSAASFTQFAPPLANPSEGAALATSVAKVLACLASVLLYLNGDLDDGLPQVSELAIAIQEELGSWVRKTLSQEFSTRMCPQIFVNIRGHHWQT